MASLADTRPPVERVARAPLRRGVVVIAVAVCGCSGGGGGGLSLPSMETVAAITKPVAEEKPVGSATELYARIARGANTCWFGATGPLKAQYIYHAEADAPSRGGKAEITIHNRDPSQPNPRGAKAYRVRIIPEGDAAAKVETETLRMPEPMAKEMTSDVGRWSKGEQGCSGASTAVGWGPRSDPAPASEAAKGAKKKPKNAKAKAPAVAAQP